MGSKTLFEQITTVYAWNSQTPTYSIIFDHIGASSALKAVHYFPSAEKKSNISHSCPPYDCMYYLYFASYTTNGITCQLC